jgi:hypothetical protein
MCRRKRGTETGAFPIAVALGRFQTGAQVLVAAPGVVGDNAFSVHFNVRMDYWSNEFGF